MKKENKGSTPLMPGEKETQHCDRCGNQSHYFGSLFFPASKIRVYLCDICFLGLSLGLKFDLERMIINQHKEALK